MRRSENESIAGASGDDLKEVKAVCERGLQWARDRDYAGWDPYDGLNSPVLKAVCRHWFLRLVGMHLVEKAPVNLRPLLAVPRERNPKGIGLFAMSHLLAYGWTGDDNHLTAAGSLLSWLQDNRSPAHGAGWGYNFDWQNGRKFFLPAHHPSIVVSVFCGRAFLEHYLETGDEDSLGVARETAAFIRDTINTQMVDGHTVYTYTAEDSFVVVNANALAAGFFARTAAATDDDDLLSRARELARFVADCQVESGAWYYAVPAEDSHLSHDNFHTGFVLESLGHVLGVEARTEVSRAYERGLRFYREHLFEDDGAPRFEHDRAYPRDAHAAGQALRTFALDGRSTSVDMAERIADWSFEALLDEDGYFYRQRGAVFADTTPYMRWSQAWMCYGLATYVAELCSSNPD